MATPLLYGQYSTPAGKVVPVPASRYLTPRTFRLQTKDTLVSAADTVAATAQAMAFTRQIGKPGYSSYVLKAPSPGSEGAQAMANLKTPAFTIHGNILYNVDYRSYIDTPYAEQDIYYHTLQTYWDVVYKNQLPVRIYLTNRFSNSAFTRQFTDVSMNWNSGDYHNRLQQVLNAWPSPSLPFDSVNRLQHQLEQVQLEKLQMMQWLQSSETLQRLINIRERELWAARNPVNVDTIWNFEQWELPGLQKPSIPGQLPLPDYLKKRSPSGNYNQPPVNLPPSPAEDSAFRKKYQEVKKLVDSLQQQLPRLEKAAREGKQWLAIQQQNERMQVSRLASANEMQREVQARQIPDSALPPGYRFLWAVKSFSIGRTVVNYSELTAKNVSINGVRLEYNPSWYLAVAAGTIDYRFRDFIVKNAAAPPQHLYLVRVGRGQMNGNNIILTWYTGKKQLYNSSGNSGGQVTQPDYRLMGFSLEGNYKLGEATLLTAELAKSSLPYYHQAGVQKNNLFSGVTRFSEHTNEAYSLKVQTAVKATGTRVQAFYKVYGAAFQSFSLITTGMQQKAWMVKADQPFLRNRLLVTASLKKNDYSNPAANTGYQNNIVFKSVQATLRVPRWPVMMAGYYPSSQLTSLGNGAYTENLFYTMVANLSHYYNVKGVGMTSTAMYTRFYNKQADSGFVYANTTNLQATQQLFYQKLTCRSTAAIALGSDYNLYTWDNEMQYTILQWLKAGVGVKYNYQTQYNIKQFGYKSMVSVVIKKLGEIQLMADKGFIPGANRRLVANNTGRFSFFRIF
ncbi:hypothetical protein GCM10011379_29530 [Filimonas zeae]|uniref:Uncharacterized protein n=2 Tax=Filimonas zeae TaxID=1737353 RepID=A0A917J043_9BACT|nr:hypothetical protein GCM10011379_29530 [Filimonas zeae]